ncbi:MAG: archaellin/type IV pilin N-terminal domain-containing protein [Thermofilum sp.]
MRRKGISPVIATLLLIVIAVAAAVLTYIWVTGYMGTLSPREVPEQLKERIKIDAVSYDTTTGTVSIYVSNIGEVDTSIISAYVLTENFTAVCDGSITAVTIQKAKTSTVSLSDCTLTSGTTYIAKVSSSGGAEATYVFRA